MYRIEDQMDPKDICFSHPLTHLEAKTIKTMIDHVLTEHRGPSTSLTWVRTQLSNSSLKQLLVKLTQFFETNPDSYFLRLSTISPKDAYYQLCVETPDELEIVDSKPTLDQIKRDLSVLKVQTAEQCLLVLCHSERVMRDIELEGQSIVLQQWKPILHDTETRCFVKNGKLLAISQYWADLDQGYTSFPDFNPTDFLERVKTFIKELQNRKSVNHTFPYQDAVVDIAYCESQLILIEMNPYTGDTDSALFEWDELLKLERRNLDTVIFRFTQNDRICEVV